MRFVGSTFDWIEELGEYWWYLLDPETNDYGETLFDRESRSTGV